MPIQAYIDESISEGQQFVFAGFIGTAEQWASFSHRWLGVASQAPRTLPFKFSEFAQTAGPFSPSRLSETAGRARVSELIATMSGAGFTRISVTIGLPAFKEMSKDWSGLELSFPYCYAFQLMIVAVALELLERGHTERFEIVFDEQVILGPKAKRWYPLIRELCVSDEIRSILPAEPLFRSDDEVLPLQAADLYAGLVRSGRGETNARRDAILSPLLVKLSAVRVTNAAEMRKQALVASAAWDNVTAKNSVASVSEGFAPVATRLQKSLDSIGGDAQSEQTLAPLFAAVGSGAPADPDGLNWIRQELAEATAISGHSQVLWTETRHHLLEAAMRKYGFTKEDLFGRTPQERPAEQFRGMPDEDVIRAIASLDEDLVNACRKKIAKMHAKASRQRKPGAPKKG